MEKKIVLGLLLGLFLAASCQQKSELATEPDVESAKLLNAYDSAKAKKYGADTYGMKKYVMALLKSGPNRSSDSTEAADLQAAHMANISRMAKEGKLVLAGPFLDGGTLRGIYIFNVETVAEAEALTNSDPAIQAGSLEMELKEWYGSAALMMMNDLHPTLTKESF
ncbi:MAG: YciI family protein [Cyclobacteriaceae bacterium]